jgi:hypothetical protein
VTCFRALLEKQSSSHKAAKEWERGADCQHALAYEKARNETDPAVALRLRTFAQSCASDADPYVHPKLATVTHKGDEDAPMRNMIEVCFVTPGASDD